MPRWTIRPRGTRRPDRPSPSALENADGRHDRDKHRLTGAVPGQSSDCPRAKQAIHSIDGTIWRPAGYINAAVQQWAVGHRLAARDPVPVRQILDQEMALRPGISNFQVS